MFGSGSITALGFIEELAPGLDVIPTATIAWAIANVDALTELRRTLGFRDPNQHHAD